MPSLSKACNVCPLIWVSFSILQVKVSTFFIELLYICVLLLNVFWFCCYWEYSLTFLQEQLQITWLLVRLYIFLNVKQIISLSIKLSSHILQPCVWIFIFSLICVSSLRVIDINSLLTFVTTIFLLCGLAFDPRISFFLSS